MCYFRRTTDSSKCPVSAHVGGSVGQVECVRPSVGVEIAVYRRNIDGVGLRALADFRFLRKDSGSVVVYIQQVNLQSSCPARRWDTIVRGHECGVI